MFCAALLLSCPCVEISIYSTCKRISQKILRNVMKFAGMIADQDMSTINCKILKENSEEIYLQGPLGKTDVRIINSYPSKVTAAKPLQKSSRKSQKSQPHLKVAPKFSNIISEGVRAPHCSVSVDGITAAPSCHRLET